MVEQLISDHYPWFLHTFRTYDKEVKQADASRIFILHHYGGMYLVSCPRISKGQGVLFRACAACCWAFSSHPEAEDTLKSFHPCACLLPC